MPPDFYYNASFGRKKAVPGTKHRRAIHDVNEVEIIAEAASAHANARAWSEKHNKQVTERGDESGLPCEGLHHAYPTRAEGN